MKKGNKFVLNDAKTRKVYNLLAIRRSALLDEADFLLTLIEIIRKRINFSDSDEIKIYDNR